MSYSFDGSNDYILKNTSVNNTTPITLACWFNAGNTAVDMGLVNISYSAGTRFNQIQLGASGDLMARVTGVNTVRSTNTFSLNTWNHAAGVFTSSTSTTVYLNGTGEQTITYTSTLQSILNRFSFGVRINTGTNPVASTYFNGKLAEIAMWQAALTKPEIQELAAGIKPIFVRPESLYIYVPLMEQVYDYNDNPDSGRPFTLNGGASLVSTSDHPRRYG